MKTLVSYTPKSLEMAGDFDRMFDSIFRSNNEVVSRPAVDIREEEGKYILEAELPGHTEENVDIKLDENLLTISTKDEKANEEKKEGYVLRERRFRSFSRSFVLPRDVDRESIEARFKNGLLTLELQKSADAKPRQIEIKKAK